MAIYGYTRVSTTRQISDGQSMEVQQRVLAGYALMTGMAIDRTYADPAVSGSIPLGERAAGRAMLAALLPGDTVLTSKLDRMFRSSLDALAVLQRLKAAGVGLHIIDLGGDVDGSGMGKLVFTILSAVAEAERDRIRERIQQSKDENRKRGRHLGGTPPFGWTVGADGYLAPHDGQQAAIGRIVALRGENLSLRAIAARLGAEGCRISHAGVRAVLEARAG